MTFDNFCMWSNRILQPVIVTISINFSSLVWMPFLIHRMQIYTHHSNGHFPGKHGLDVILSLIIYQGDLVQSFMCQIPTSRNTLASPFLHSLQLLNGNGCNSLLHQLSRCQCPSWCHSYLWDIVWTTKSLLFLFLNKEQRRTMTWQLMLRWWLALCDCSPYFISIYFQTVT